MASMTHATEESSQLPEQIRRRIDRETSDHNKSVTRYYCMKAQYDDLTKAAPSNAPAQNVKESYKIFNKLLLDQGEQPVVACDTLRSTVNLALALCSKVVKNNVAVATVTTQHLKSRNADDLNSHKKFVRECLQICTSIHKNFETNSHQRLDRRQLRDIFCVKCESCSAEQGNDALKKARQYAVLAIIAHPEDAKVAVAKWAAAASKTFEHARQSSEAAVNGRLSMLMTEVKFVSPVESLETIIDEYDIKRDLLGINWLFKFNSKNDALPPVVGNDSTFSNSRQLSLAALSDTNDDHNYCQQFPWLDLADLILEIYNSHGTTFFTSDELPARKKRLIQFKLGKLSMLGKTLTATDSEIKLTTNDQQIPAMHPETIVLHQAKACLHLMQLSYEEWGVFGIKYHPRHLYAKINELLDEQNFAVEPNKRNRDFAYISRRFERRLLLAQAIILRVVCARQWYARQVHRDKQQQRGEDADSGNHREETSFSSSVCLPGSAAHENQPFNMPAFAEASQRFHRRMRWARDLFTIQDLHEECNLLKHALYHLEKCCQNWESLKGSAENSSVSKVATGSETPSKNSSKPNNNDAAVNATAFSILHALHSLAAIFTHLRIVPDALRATWCAWRLVTTQLDAAAAAAAVTATAKTGGFKSHAPPDLMLLEAIEVFIRLFDTLAGLRSSPVLLTQLLDQMNHYLEPLKNVTPDDADFDTTLQNIRLHSSRGRSLLAIYYTKVAFVCHCKDEAGDFEQFAYFMLLAHKLLSTISSYQHQIALSEWYAVYGTYVAAPPSCRTHDLHNAQKENTATYRLEKLTCERTQLDVHSHCFLLWYSLLAAYESQSWLQRTASVSTVFDIIGNTLASSERVVRAMLRVGATRDARTFAEDGAQCAMKFLSPRQTGTFIVLLAEQSAMNDEFGQTYFYHNLSNTIIHNYSSKVVQIRITDQQQVRDACDNGKTDSISHKQADDQLIYERVYMPTAALGPAVHKSAAKSSANSKSHAESTADVRRNLFGGDSNGNARPHITGVTTSPQSSVISSPGPTTHIHDANENNQDDQQAPSHHAAGVPLSDLERQLNRDVLRHGLPFTAALSTSCCAVSNDDAAFGSRLHRPPVAVAESAKKPFKTARAGGANGTVTKTGKHLAVVNGTGPDDCECQSCLDLFASKLHIEHLLRIFRTYNYANITGGSGGQAASSRTVSDKLVFEIDAACDVALKRAGLLTVRVLKNVLKRSTKLDYVKLDDFHRQNRVLRDLEQRFKIERLRHVVLTTEIAPEIAGKVEKSFSELLAEFAVDLPSITDAAQIRRWWTAFAARHAHAYATADWPSMVSELFYLLAVYELRSAAVRRHCTVSLLISSSLWLDAQLHETKLGDDRARNVPLNILPEIDVKEEDEDEQDADSTYATPPSGRSPALSRRAYAEVSAVASSAQQRKIFKAHADTAKAAPVKSTVQLNDHEGNSSADLSLSPVIASNKKYMPSAVRQQQRGEKKLTDESRVRKPFSSSTSPLVSSSSSRGGRNNNGAKPTKAALLGSSRFRAPVKRLQSTAGIQRRYLLRNAAPQKFDAENDAEDDSDVIEIDSSGEKSGRNPRTATSARKATTNVGLSPADEIMEEEPEQPRDIKRKPYRPSVVFLSRRADQENAVRGKSISLAKVRQMCSTLRQRLLLSVSHDEHSSVTGDGSDSSQLLAQALSSRLTLSDQAEYCTDNDSLSNVSAFFCRIRTNLEASRALLQHDPAMPLFRQTTRLQALVMHNANNTLPSDSSGAASSSSLSRAVISSSVALADSIGNTFRHTSMRFALRPIIMASKTTTDEMTLVRDVCSARRQLIGFGSHNDVDSVLRRIFAMPANKSLTLANITYYPSYELGDISGGNNTSNNVSILALTRFNAGVAENDGQPGESSSPQYSGTTVFRRIPVEGRRSLSAELDKIRMMCQQPTSVHTASKPTQAESRQFWKEFYTAEDTLHRYLESLDSEILGWSRIMLFGLPSRAVDVVMYERIRADLRQLLFSLAVNSSDERSSLTGGALLLLGNEHFIDIMANGVCDLGNEEIVEMLAYMLQMPLSSTSFARIVRQVILLVRQHQQEQVLSLKSYDSDTVHASSTNHSKNSHAADGAASSSKKRHQLQTRNGFQPPAWSTISAVFSDRSPVVLLVDKYSHMVSWEMMPSLQAGGQVTTRVPSLHHLLALMQHNRHPDNAEAAAAKCVDASKMSFVINPDGTLKKCEMVLAEWYKNNPRSSSVFVGHAPSSSDFLQMLRTSDALLYCGHGSGLQYVFAESVEQLADCRAVIMLMGCSSVALEAPGQIDPFGTPLYYVACGAPATLGMLWRVYDNQTNELTQKLLEFWLQAPRSNQYSLVQALNEARSEQESKHLAGGACVVYGLPDVLARDGSGPKKILPTSSAATARK